jgi:hypothetical protein
MRDGYLRQKSCRRHNNAYQVAMFFYLRRIQSGDCPYTLHYGVLGGTPLVGSGRQLWNVLVTEPTQRLVGKKVSITAVESVLAYRSFSRIIG